MENEHGKKDDASKLPMHLIDRTALLSMAAVLQHGAQQYGAENWRGGIAYSRIIASAMRHIHALNDCEDIDPDSGELHAAHAMCQLMFLIWMMRCRPDLDDRWRGVQVETKIPNPSIKDEQFDSEIAELAKKFAPIVQEIKTND